MTTLIIDKKLRTANIVLAIGGLNGFVSTEVQNSTYVLRLKFSAKNPAHRQYAARSVFRVPCSVFRVPCSVFICLITNNSITLYDCL